VGTRADLGQRASEGLFVANARKSPRVRTFTPEDIPQVTDLHRRVFGLSDEMSPKFLDAYRTYFTDVFLDSTWEDEPVGSLVHEESNGKLTGFLGIVPRRMAVNDEKFVRARITSQFAVDPDFRGGVGLKLLSAALAGPQDLTIADESNGDSRMLWERLGGVTSHLYSMRWLYPLRPCQFAFFAAKKTRMLPSLVSAISMPFAKILDSVSSGLIQFPVRLAGPGASGEELDCETLLACLSEAGREQSIRVDYNTQTLSWVLQRAEQMRQKHGPLQKVLVRTEKGEIGGWYLYHLNPSGFSEVIGLQAKAHLANYVLDHLIYHAWRHGATVLSGRMEPSLMRAFSDKHCIFHSGPQWTLLHSRRPELLQAYNQGNAGFLRLDGEWCLHFR
jgi:ribosomal protein S18 acetylase RimI-like enzyme